MTEAPHRLEQYSVAWHPSHLGLLNTAPSLYLIFAVDDLFYAPIHKVMHWKVLYPYIHKHHHRQSLPVRGRCVCLCVCGSHQPRV